MNVFHVLQFANLFFTGILAGMEVVIHYGLQGPSAALNDFSQLQLRQGLVLRLRVLVPVFFIPALTSAATLALLAEAAPGLNYGHLGLVALLIWIGLRVIGTVPLNSATLTWDLSAPPSNWKEQVARAERFHDVGVWAAVLAFASFLLSSHAAPAS